MSEPQRMSEEEVEELLVWLESAAPYDGRNIRGHIAGLKADLAAAKKRELWLWDHCELAECISPSECQSTQYAISGLTAWHKTREEAIEAAIRRSLPAPPEKP